MPYNNRHAQITDSHVLASLLREIGYFVLVNGETVEATSESYLHEFYRKYGWEERDDAANFMLAL